jgi:cytochrome c oxidase subunit 2
VLAGGYRHAGYGSRIRKVEIVTKGRFSLLAAGAGLAVLGLATVARADELNMTPGVTEISRSVYDLHMYIIWICVLIGIVVFGAMFWSLLKHRKARGHEPAQFHESTGLEIAWTLVPLAILIAIAYPATQVLVDMYDTGGEDMTVEVRGYQWKWQYKYLDEDYNSTVSFFSNLATPQDQIRGRQEKAEHYLL